MDRWWIAQRDKMECVVYPSRMTVARASRLESGLAVELRRDAPTPVIRGG